jgi:hypothetical protein
MQESNWYPGVTLDELEKGAILKAFKFYRGNKTQTANVLGIAIRTLDNKLEKYAADDRIHAERAARDAIERKAQLDRARGIVPTVQANGHTVNTRVYVQPPSEVPEKQPVPVSQQEKIQEVLPPKTASGRNK